MSEGLTPLLRIPKTLEEALEIIKGYQAIVLALSKKIEALEEQDQSKLQEFLNPPFSR